MKFRAFGLSILAILLSLQTGISQPAGDASAQLKQLRDKAVLRGWTSGQQWVSTHVPAIEQLGKELAGIDKDALSIDGQIELDLLKRMVEGARDYRELLGDRFESLSRLVPAEHLLRTLRSSRTRSLSQEKRRAYIRWLFESWSVQLKRAGEMVGRSTKEEIRGALERLKGVTAFGNLYAARSTPEEVVAAAKAFVKSSSTLEEQLNAAQDAAPDRPAADRDLTDAELYPFRLKHQVKVDQSPGALLKFGMKHWRRTIELLKAHCRQHRGHERWQEWLKEIQAAHPKAEDVATVVKDEADRALAFTRERKLASLPKAAEDYRVFVDRSVETQPFGYFRPAGRDRKGTFHLVDLQSLPEEVCEARIGDFNQPFLRTVALHEYVPGHHLQHLVRERHPLDSLRGTPLWTEGWGLYTEWLFNHHGYFDDDPDGRLCQLQMRLWRCARVICDVGLQTDSMTDEEGEKLLHEGVGFSAATAHIMVGHFRSRPGYFLGYLVGQEALVAIREAVAEEMGDQFTDLAFHDALLRFSPLPMDLLRVRMLYWAKHKE